MNEFRIDFYRIFRIFFHLLNQSNCKLSNWTNFERIHFQKIWLHPIVGVGSNELNSNWFSSNFSNIFCAFKSIESQIIKSNEFRTNSNFTPSLRYTHTSLTPSLVDFHIASSISLLESLSSLWVAFLGADKMKVLQGVPCLWVPYPLPFFCVYDSIMGLDASFTCSSKSK